MKIIMVIVRTLMGLLFIFASITFFFNLIQPPPMEGVVKSFNEGLNSTRYFFPVLKTVELLCGLAFVTGYFVPLATVVIAPVIVQIALFHGVVDHNGLPVAIFLVLANIFVAYYYRDAYKPLLRP